MQITEKTGKPPVGYTNQQWQLDFQELKKKVIPSHLGQMPIIPEFPYNAERTYHGKTQYQYYCDFINDILQQIRRGNVDYCLYIYQVCELLKYEPERLRATWLEDEEYFRLSL